MTTELEQKWRQEFEVEYRGRLFKRDWQELYIDRDLELIWAGYLTACHARHTEAEALREKHEKLKLDYQRYEMEIQQTLGKALGYPWFKDDLKNFPDATEEHGVCVGDHVAASLAMEAAEKIEALRAENAQLKAELNSFAEDR